jgi:hypothetical protein
VVGVRVLPGSPKHKLNACISEIYGRFLWGGYNIGAANEIKTSSNFGDFLNRENHDRLAKGIRE